MRLLFCYYDIGVMCVWLILCQGAVCVCVCVGSMLCGGGCSWQPIENYLPQYFPLINQKKWLLLLGNKIIYSVWNVIHDMTSSILWTEEGNVTCRSVVITSDDIVVSGGEEGKAPMTERWSLTCVCISCVYVCNITLQMYKWAAKTEAQTLFDVCMMMWAIPTILILCSQWQPQWHSVILGISVLYCSRRGWLRQKVTGWQAGYLMPGLPQEANDKCFFYQWLTLFSWQWQWGCCCPCILCSVSLYSIICVGQDIPTFSPYIFDQCVANRGCSIC